MNETFAEILLYPCTQEELNERIAAKLRAHFEKSVHIPPVGSPVWNELLNDAIKRSWQGVRYTEIIGAIEVHRVETQLRADYWFSDSKVIPGSRKRPQVRWRGKVVEVEYAGSALSSSQIFDDFRAQLIREIRNTRSLRGRHVDLEAFERSGPYVDWRSVLGL